MNPTRNKPDILSIPKGRLHISSASGAHGHCSSYGEARISVKGPNSALRLTYLPSTSL